MTIQKKICEKPAQIWPTARWIHNKWKLKIFPNGKTASITSHWVFVSFPYWIRVFICLSRQIKMSILICLCKLIPNLPSSSHIYGIYKCEYLRICRQAFNVNEIDGIWNDEGYPRQRWFYYSKKRTTRTVSSVHSFIGLKF